MNCKNCGEKIDRPQAERMPGQVLRNQALFPSERMTIAGTVLSGTANEFTGTVNVNLGGNGFKTYTLALDALRPKRLYDLPHLPLSAFIILKDTIVTYRGNAAAAHVYNIVAKYVDLAGVSHYIGAGNVAAPIGNLQSAIIFQNDTIVIPATPLNVSEPLNVGSIVLEGMVILGADTGTFDVALNVGLLYATPEG